MLVFTMRLREKGMVTRNPFYYHLHKRVNIVFMTDANMKTPMEYMIGINAKIKDLHCYYQ